MINNKIVEEYNRYKPEGYGNKEAKVIIEKDLYRDVDYEWLSYIHELIKNTGMVKIYKENGNKLVKGDIKYNDYLKLSISGFIGGGKHSNIKKDIKEVINEVNMSRSEVIYFHYIYIERTIKEIYKAYENNEGKYTEDEIYTGVRNILIGVATVKEILYDEDSVQEYIEFVRKLLKDLYREDGKVYNRFLESCLDKTVKIHFK